MKNPIESLGFLVVAFQQLEEDFRQTFSFLLHGADYRAARIIGTELSFNRLLKILKCLGPLIIKESDDKVGELDDLISRALTIEQNRNTYVHSHYSIAEITSNRVSYARIKASNNKKGVYQIKDEILSDPTAIDSITKQAREISASLSELNEKLFFSFASKEEVKAWISEK